MTTQLLAMREPPQVWELKIVRREMMNGYWPADAVVPPTTRQLYKGSTSRGLAARDF